MNILITGGAGFIGSHVAERLLRKGRRLTIIDDLNDFYPPAWKRQNLAEITQTGPIDFHQIDICDQKAVFTVVARAMPDVIIHLAARAGVRPSLEDPLLYEQVNVRGTLVLLEARRRFGVRKFIFASSSSVYGAENRVPFRETGCVDFPISPYAATKIAGERLCYTYSHLYSISVVCLRFFTVYGPRQRPDLAIRKFVESIEQGRRIQVFGSGASARDYTYVEDIAAGVAAAVSYHCGYELFNLGNSDPITLTDMIRTIENALGKKAILDHVPEQPGDVPITYADISKARRLLDYRPATKFPEGIEKFVAWHRRRPAFCARRQKGSKSETRAPNFPAVW